MLGDRTALQARARGTGRWKGWELPAVWAEHVFGSGRTCLSPGPWKLFEATTLRPESTSHVLSSHGGRPRQEDGPGRSPAEPRRATSPGRPPAQPGRRTQQAWGAEPDSSSGARSADGEETLWEAEPVLAGAPGPHPPHLPETGALCCPTPRPQGPLPRAPLAVSPSASSLLSYTHQGHACPFPPPVPTVSPPPAAGERARGGHAVHR